MARRWTALLLSLAVVAVLTGCEPAPVPNAAVAIDSNGAPVVVTVPCDGAAVTYVSVYEKGGSSNHLTWRISQPGDNVSGPVEFPVFTVPPGWDVSQDDLTYLEDNKPYGVLVAVGRRDIAYAGFTLADLKALKAGQVWVDSDGGRAMDRADFEDAAERSCH